MGGTGGSFGWGAGIMRKPEGKMQPKEVYLGYHRPEGHILGESGYNHLEMYRPFGNRF